jgi:hypothetical protein
MIIYLNSTSNLGDFLNAMPVLSGIHKDLGKFKFMIKGEMNKFKGIKEFLLYQGLFEEVFFDNENFVHGNIHVISSWTHETKRNPNRPTETCRYENFVKDHYGWTFEVDDAFEIKVPDFNMEVAYGYWVGDRWSVGDIDNRRETHILSFLKNQDYHFLDYDNDLLTNAYIIKTLNKPFITNFTGVGMLADLLNKELYCVWHENDWKPEFRRGKNVSWDNGKDIEHVFQKHFFSDRKAKLVHRDDLRKLLV